eukprot:TRINITY_DN15765_c0_g4_i1.p1 TRINITY_DN15765_c0_g4~~TRINITY_DN15765_c0_g4_i1.p1  ORF type:complete len:146 (-),score=22.35 TRINITY_DN15765_c0_g4_i1:1-381(-)
MCIRDRLEIDYTVYCQHGFIDSYFLKYLSQNIRKKIGGNPNITVAGPIAARIPVLDITFKNEELQITTKVQITLNGFLSIANTKLVWTYGKMDERCLLLGRLIKHWAKKKEVCSTKINICLLMHMF